MTGGRTGTQPDGDAPTVRAVVVTWNGANLLPAALDSLLAQRPGVPMEVVVVDNASTDGTAELLTTRYPRVTTITAPRNLGFAGGAAMGMAGFDGDFVVLLNNDARFEDGAVAALVEAARAPGNAGVAAVTAEILLEPVPGRPVLVNSTGTEVTGWGAGIDRDWRVPRGSESTDPEVFGFCGGAALLRMSAVRQVGGLDPSLFLYYEDLDLSWRLRAAGWTVRFEPRAVAWHRHAASTGTDSPTFRYYNTRNSLVVAARHAPARVAVASAGRQLLGLVRVAARTPWRDERLRARARGLRDAARRAPRLLAERRRMWRSATVSRGAVWRVARGNGTTGS